MTPYLTAGQLDVMGSLETDGQVDRDGRRTLIVLTHCETSSFRMVNNYFNSSLRESTSNQIEN